MVDDFTMFVLGFMSFVAWFIIPLLYYLGMIS